MNIAGRTDTEAEALIAILSTVQDPDIKVKAKRKGGEIEWWK